jgi:hypothetical protein
MASPLSPATRVQARHSGSRLQFIIGQDPEGHWIVAEVCKRCGGIFVSRDAAVKYAVSEWGFDPQMIRWSNEPLSSWI